MKFAYKVIKNKNKRKTTIEETAAKISASVISFILVAKVTLGFRECAKIVRIAKVTDCKVEIASGMKSGDSESILSLVALGITADKSLVMTIKGERGEEAFKGISRVLNGKLES